MVFLLKNDYNDFCPKTIHIQKLFYPFDVLVTNTIGAEFKTVSFRK